ncbi:hypothetical protein CK203_112458 [Vitis vinifera]|uniref:Retrotransposon gag domain-containing protein n=1 Tax=Vitis vinifera TaxID=29760 RepID=A0A438CWZ3_VITVI|nr:hypothetical protein CK203_112458 [Vitis vinifera]
MEGGRQMFSSKIAKIEIPRLRRAYKEEEKVVTWALFEEELWARFRPKECEDFDEALSRVEQVGSLWTTQRNLKNCTTVWKDGHKKH